MARHLQRKLFSAHLYNLLDGSAAHDRIVDQQDVAPLEFKWDCVELASNRFLTLGLARHNKCAADITIFNQAFAIFDPRRFGHFKRHRARRVRHRNDAIYNKAGGLNLQRQP